MKWILALLLMLASTTPAEVQDEMLDEAAVREFVNGFLPALLSFGTPVRQAKKNPPGLLPATRSHILPRYLKLIGVGDAYPPWIW